METDVCIIGAGPAGVFASIFAAQSGAETVILEHNTIACRKLLQTGGGRCNLTHIGPVEDFIRACSPFGRFLRHSLYEFSADALQQYFAERGLQTKVENHGCVFPITDRAGDVARILIDHARTSSVDFMYGTKIQSITKDRKVFTVFADTKKISARTVIIATGGVTSPGSGSRGAGYKFAQAFGHTIVGPRASLASLITAQSWPGRLRGVAVQNVVISTGSANRKVRTCGSLMFTGNGISGPAVLDLSRFITDFLPAHDNPIGITIDLLPDYGAEQLDAEIISLCSEHPKKDLAGALVRFLPRALMLNLCEQLNPSETILAGALKKSQRRQLTGLLKQLPLSIVATGAIAEATVTRGGVSTSEINSKTMESKLCSGLFFAGEVINVDGPCGGFNLQIAFSTGHLAGKTAVRCSI